MGVKSRLRKALRLSPRAPSTITIRPEDGWKLVALQRQEEALGADARRLGAALRQAAHAKATHFRAMAARYGFDPGGEYTLDDTATTLTRTAAPPAVSSAAAEKPRVAPTPPASDPKAEPPAGETTLPGAATVKTGAA